MSVLKFAVSLAVAAAPGWIAAATTSSELSFIDLRAQVGLVPGINQVDGASAESVLSKTAALTLMFGDIGTADSGAIDWDADLGVVLGLRLAAGHWQGHGPATAASGEAFNTIGGTAVGGFGLYETKQVQLELVGLYGIGYNSTERLSHGEFKRAGRYRTYGGEFAVFYTFAEHYQLGGVLGYEVLKADLEPAGQSASVAVRAGGFNGNISLGYRF